MQIIPKCFFFISYKFMFYFRQQKYVSQIIATESLNTKHQTEQSFQVELLNWNDELPKFKEDEYLFEVNETITMNSLIGQVTATDRDIDDRIM